MAYEFRAELATLISESLSWASAAQDFVATSRRDGKEFSIAQLTNSFVGDLERLPMRPSASRNGQWTGCSDWAFQLIWAESLDRA
jgi:hypothetical protein